MGYYKVTFQCATCGHRWKGKLKNLDDPDPPCANLNCGADQTPRGMDFNNPRAPAAIGMSTQTKAIDETARIVMEDHKLGDLKSDVRSGETMTPKLPPRQQAMADAVFSGNRPRKLGGVKMPTSMHPNIMKARINAGGLAPGSAANPDVVAMTHAAKLKPAVRIVAEDKRRS